MSRTIPWKARRRSARVHYAIDGTGRRPSATSPSSSTTIRTGAARRRPGRHPASSRAVHVVRNPLDQTLSIWSKNDACTSAAVRPRGIQQVGTTVLELTPTGSPRRQSGLGRTCGDTAARRSPTASADACFATTTSLPTRWVSFVGSSGSCSALRRRRHRRAAARHHRETRAARLPARRDARIRDRRAPRHAGGCIDRRRYARRAGDGVAAVLAATNDTHLLGGTASPAEAVTPPQNRTNAYGTIPSVYSTIDSRVKKSPDYGYLPLQHRLTDFTPLAGLQLQSAAPARRCRRAPGALSGSGGRRQRRTCRLSPSGDHLHPVAARRIERGRPVRGSDPPPPPLQPADGARQGAGRGSRSAPPSPRGRRRPNSRHEGPVVLERGPRSPRRR